MLRVQVQYAKPFNFIRTCAFLLNILSQENSELRGDFNVNTLYHDLNLHGNDRINERFDVCLTSLCANAMNKLYDEAWTVHSSSI